MKMKILLILFYIIQIVLSYNVKNNNKMTMNMDDDNDALLQSYYKYNNIHNDINNNNDDDDAILSSHNNEPVFAEYADEYIVQPSGRGQIVKCIIKNLKNELRKKGGQREIVPRAYAVDLSISPKKRTVSQNSSYTSCFTAGRGNYQKDWTIVPPTASESSGWYDTLNLYRYGSLTKHHTKLKIANKRKETVNVTVMVNSTGKPFTKSVLAPKKTSTLITTVNAPNTSAAYTWRGFPWKWKATPIHYFQSKTNVQLISHDVVIVVENRKTKTRFRAWNTRLRDLDTPVILRFKIHAENGTNINNLKVTHHKTQHSMKWEYKVPRLAAGLVVGEIEPVDINQPWSFDYSYMWRAGFAATTLFGVPIQG